MVSTKRAFVGAGAFLPKRVSLPTLAHAAQACRGCDLYRNATQAVFGEGPRDARAVFVGEVPGNDEDIEGHPFVGPAGRVLDRAFAAANIARGDVYLTNAVKHFKWVARGTRRLHRKPSTREVKTCIPWLEEEIDLVRPEIIVLLGATAAQALLGKELSVTRERGHVIARDSRRYLATVHPASVLRAMTHDDRERAMAAFVHDIRAVAHVLA
jgi:DNA polymerase